MTLTPSVYEDVAIDRIELLGDDGAAESCSHARAGLTGRLTPALRRLENLANGVGRCGGAAERRHDAAADLPDDLAAPGIIRDHHGCADEQRFERYQAEDLVGRRVHDDVGVRQ